MVIFVDAADAPTKIMKRWSLKTMKHVSNTSKPTMVITLGKPIVLLKKFTRCSVKAIKSILDYWPECGIMAR